MDQERQPQKVVRAVDWVVDQERQPQKVVRAVDWVVDQERQPQEVVQAVAVVRKMHPLVKMPRQLLPLCIEGLQDINYVRELGSNGYYVCCHLCSVI